MRIHDYFNNATHLIHNHTAFKHNDIFIGPDGNLYLITIDNNDLSNFGDNNPTVKFNKLVIEQRADNTGAGRDVAPQQWTINNNDNNDDSGSRSRHPSNIGASRDTSLNRYERAVLGTVPDLRTRRKPDHDEEVGGSETGS